MSEVQGRDKDTYTYFAFISYNRKDLTVAEFIQDTLEHYRYPRESIDEKYWPEDREYVRKIFLDKSHLSGRGEDFEELLSGALSRSRYLIVVCSPEAAALKPDSSKHYVNWEIETFLKLHGESAISRVIPVIYCGEPSLSADSCLPLPLRNEAIVHRNLPDMRPVAPQKATIWNRRQYWYQAVITLLTYVFDVERSIIFDRFEAERARRRTRLICISSIVAILFALLATWFVLERNRAWVERNMAWVEAEKSKAQLQVSENQKQDAVARISFNEALEIIQRDDASADRSLAMLHLLNAWRLPEARRRASLLLQQASWLVPVEIREAKSRPAVVEPLDLSKPRVVPQHVPKDFPLEFHISMVEVRATLKDSGQQLWTLDSKMSYIHSLNVSPDGRYLVLLKQSPRMVVEAYDTYTGACLWSKEVESVPYRFAFSSDGLRCAVLLQNMSLKVFRNDNGREEFEYCRAPEHTWDIAFTDDNFGIIATGTQEVRYAFVMQSMEQPVLNGLDKPVTAYCVSPSRKQLILACYASPTRGTIDIYDVETLQRQSTWDISGYVTTLSISGDGKYLAVIHDKAFSVYDISPEGKNSRLIRHEFSSIPDRLLFDASSKQCLIAGGLGEVWVWDSVENTCVNSSIRADGSISDIGWARDGRLVTCGSTIAVWDWGSGKLLRQSKLNGIFETMRFAGEYVVCGSRVLRQVGVYTMEGKEVWRTKPYSEPGVIPFVVSESAGIVALADSRQSVRCFDLATGEPITEKIYVDDAVSALQICSREGDQAYYLFIGGGTMNQGFHVVYDIAARDIIYRGATSGSRIDCFHQLANNLVLLGGKSCTDHYVFALPEVKEYDLGTLKSFFENYAGVSLNSRGISSELSSRSLHVAKQAAVFPGALTSHRERLSLGRITMEALADELSRKDYESALLALHRVPDNLSAMSNSWVWTARLLAVKNHSLRNPDKSEKQLSAERVAYTSSDWALFIVSDSQARYYADYVTARMVALYPGEEVAQKDRQSFMRMTGHVLSQDELDAQSKRVNVTWAGLVSDPSGVTFEKLHELALNRLMTACKSREDVKVFLTELALLMTKNPEARDLDFTVYAQICDLISKVCDAIKHVPKSQELLVPFLQALVEGSKQIGPEGMVRKLLFDLECCVSEVALCAGDLTQGRQALLRAQGYSKDSPEVAAGMLTYLQALEYVVSGQAEKSLATWSSYLATCKGNMAELALVMTKQLWQSLETMKRNGVALGSMEAIRLQLRKQFHVGIPVKVDPNGFGGKSGWKNDDRLLEYGGIPIVEREDLTGVFFAYSIMDNPPKRVVVKVKHANETREYTVVPNQKLGIMD